MSADEGAITSQDRVRVGLARVRERIYRAAAGAGRSPESVRLVVVTKGRTPEEVETVLREGATDIGENRMSEAYERWLAFSSAGASADTTTSVPVFHFVGHLQRNKLAKACRFVDYLHSLDSLELARAMAARSGRAGERESCRIQVLVEVNVTGEPQKHGIAVESARSFVEELAAIGVSPVGLMCMSRLGASPAEHRRYFETLACLRDRLAEEVTPSITELSMGMTDDFEEAIAAGSTMVRIGRAIFEPEAR